MQVCCCIARCAAAWKCSWCILEVRSGPTRTTESGLSPKGEFDADEDQLEAAKREFREETGLVANGEYRPLKPIRQTGGKIVYAWTVHCDLEAAAVKSNTFSMEWPRGSGKMREFPEIDRAEWFKIDLARLKILKSQLGLLEQLEQAVSSRS